MLSQSFIRWLDRYPGALLCLSLTIVRKLTDPFRGGTGAVAEPRRILFLKLIEQGATVLAHEAVQKATARVGRRNVYFCVFAENRAIVDLLDLVPAENVIEMRTQGLVRFVQDCLRLFVRCRREGIDTTIDMEFLARAPAVLAFLSGARYRVGLHRFTSEAPYRGDLMTHRVQYNPYMHTADSYSLLVDALDASPSDTPLLKSSSNVGAEIPRLRPSLVEQRRILDLIEAEAGRPLQGPLVLLNSNAGDLLPLRRWGSDRFIELGKRILAEQPNVTIGLTGAPGEREASEHLAQEIGTAPRVISLAGKTSLADLLVVYSVADVLITNDSGPGHFASLTPIHNIVLFGPETPQLFGPRGGRPHVLWAGLACSPCVSAINHRRSPCRDNVCMQAFQVDQIYRELETCLGDVRETGPAGSRLQEDSP